MSDYFPRRELQEMGFSEVAIRALEKVSELAGTITRVDTAETGITSLETDVAALETGKQPLDADLTAIAALATTAAGRSVLTLADPNADRILFWDDSAGTITALEPVGLTISGTTIKPKFSGAFVHMAGDQAAANYTGNAAIPFDSEASGYDTDGWHSTVTNNSRLTVPADLGISKISLTGYVSIASGTAGDFFFVNIFKNGALFLPGARVALDSGSTNPACVVVANDIPVVAGDYFEVFLQVETDNSITVSSNRTAFSVKVTDWS